MKNCIFCKIARGEIPKEFIYKDEEVMVFPDINPIAPVHLLIIPVMHVEEILTVENPHLFATLFSVIQKMAREHMGGAGFRISLNGGGAQHVSHLHIHLFGPIGKSTKM